MVAFAAVIALVASIVSDAVGGHFWERHALIANLVGSLVVVMLSIAVANEALERRRRQRWTVLAQYVMVELAGNARVIWTGVATLAGLMPSGPRTTSVLDAGSRAVRDKPRLVDAITKLVANPKRAQPLQEGLCRFVAGSDGLLGRWAAVLLNVDVYAELIDRHVELALEVSWLGSVLGGSATEAYNAPPNRCGHPAVQVESQMDRERLVARVVAVTQLAEDLDRLTLGVARRLVPLRWWAERLGTTPAVWTSDRYPGSAEQRAADRGC